MGTDGGIADYSNTCGIVEAKLHSFKINSAELRPSHIIWLNEFVVPLVEDGGSLSLVGEASRSGSAAHNQALSIRRAQSVLQHIQRQVKRGFPSRYGGAVSGAGEAVAKAAGLKDGTEDAFYRAVVVRAWARPSPPEPPRPKPEVPKTVRRVIRRYWESVDTRTRDGGGSPWESGEFGAALADFLKKLSDMSQKGGSDLRSYHAYPPEYVVVRVHDTTLLDDTIGGTASSVKTMRSTREILCEWGPYTPRVTLFKKSTFRYRYSNVPKVDSSIADFPRDQIWKRTTAPDAKVLG